MKLELLSSSNSNDAASYYSYDLPGIDLPIGTNPEPGRRFEHAKAKVRLACDLTRSHWHKAVTDARTTVLAAKADLSRAIKESKAARAAFEAARRPDPFALCLAAVVGTLAIGAEYYLSNTTIGPAFGVEAGSLPGCLLAALPLVVVAACHGPAEKLFSFLRAAQRAPGLSRKLLAVSLDVLLAVGIVWANYKMIASLAPLRQQVAILLQGAEERGAILPETTEAGSGKPAATDTVDNTLLFNCVFLLGTVAALDSLLLLLLVHREVRSMSRRSAFRREFAEWERKRADARTRLRAAKRDYVQRRFLWRNREKRLEAINDAMLKREECDLFPQKPEEDQSPRARVNRTLSKAAALRLVG